MKKCGTAICPTSGPGSSTATEFTAPTNRRAVRARDQDWELVLDTSSAEFIGKTLGRLIEYELQPRSLAILPLTNLCRRRMKKPQLPFFEPGIPFDFR